MVCDQIRKGSGYPVSLSEAHEQAVVRASDRELFYDLLGSSSVSTKLRKKQLVNF